MAKGLKIMGERDIRTVLLVEDEAIIALAEKKTLEAYGYAVVLAHSGERAIECFQRNAAIDSVLMYIDLGAEIDGTETSAAILKIHEIPVVFLSSHTEPAMVEKTEKITSYGYVVKDSSATVLDASIKMAFKLFDANQRVKETNSKLEAMLAALPDPLAEVGLDGFCYEYHAPHKGSSVASAVRLRGAKLNTGLPSAAHDTVLAAIREADETGFSFGKQYKLEFPDGKRWFEMSISR